ncbi:Ppx/GppA family phosphatase [Paenibacillus sp. H1-7]|uniref:Ppx/GppA phosphatase family protein n=1 Tax=Paenibacillus sp. H1-7 TaxID=2282849 RepID=UPI001EF98A22|nr:Ppx/GppA phosphatase family protein [Paenibacillus sp. H1-7]ULL14399.1 Ppx/GppA family phosphatase [Paenibacillus sp. H1-7]
MSSNRRIGIIDIGSNSIRLVIYEINSLQAYRVIGEFKQSARLSQRINSDNTLSREDIQSIVAILKQFQRICTANQVEEIRAAATAAIRNAANSQQIISELQEYSGIRVELLSGEDEARIGFLGMIHSLDIPDGILIDIGGGSTEVSLFRQRKLVRSVSFPFGAVNTTRRFSADGDFSEEKLLSIRQMVREAIGGERWITEHPGLPMIGLGGTIRSLCKINQKKHKYSLPLTHNYPMSAEEMAELMSWLPSLPAEKRKKVDGLSKDRFDIIVPGLTILDTLFKESGCSHYVISGAGLRDGLFQEAYLTDNSAIGLNMPERSARNMLALHSCSPMAHLEQVASSALTLFDALQQTHGYDARVRLCLHIAALLYRIGVSMTYYQFSKHSFYMIAHSRLDGLTHRETVLCAAIASYKAKSRVQQLYAQFKDVLLETDIDVIVKLGSLLQLAIAMDSSETQVLPVRSAAVTLDKELDITVQTQNDPSIEYNEIAALNKDFKKIWGLKLTLLDASSFSTN